MRYPYPLGAPAVVRVTVDERSPDGPISLEGPLDRLQGVAEPPRGVWLLPVCRPAGGSGTAPARRKPPARPVTRALWGVEVRGFEPLASSVRASWG
jgi:hypothetical protein